MLIDFAEELKAARISKDLSLHQIAVKTKIDYKFLEAMESGDFEFLPEVYVKAFLKDYLKVLEVDQKTYLKKYETAKFGNVYSEKKEAGKPGETEKPEAEPVQERQPLSSFDAIRRYKRLGEEGSALRRRKSRIYYTAATSVLFLAAVLYIFFFRSEDELVIPETPYEEVIGESETGSGTQEFSETQGRTAAGDSLRLTISASDTSWIRITVDDSRTEEFLLFPQSQKVISAVSNFKIIFGNAGAIGLTLDGKPLTFRSKRAVQRIRIDSSGISELEQSSIKE